MTTTTPTPSGDAPTRGIKEAWLYTWGGLILYALILYGLAVATTLAWTQETDFWLWILLVGYALALTGFAWFCRCLKAGLWGRTATAGHLMILLVPAVVTSTVSWSDLNWFLPGQIPWFLACSVWAFSSHRKATLPLILLGFAGAAAAMAVGFQLHPGSERYVMENVAPALWPTWFMTVLMPLMTWLTVWWWGVILKLERARKTEADLAVTRERLRFASDLHDIQGHHLQVIALKAELAERMLDRDVEASRAQLKEVRLEAQTALEQTRALVQGLRQVSLEDELTNATDVLTSAGIESTHRVAGAPSSSPVRQALGLVAREATTNILRHSRATKAAYRLERTPAEIWTLTVSNDGVAIPGQAVLPGENDGTGLTGLRERLRSLGGDLTLGHHGDTFTVTATAPDAVSTERETQNPLNSETRPA